MREERLEDTRLRRFVSYLRTRGRPVDERSRVAAERALRMQGEFRPADLVRRCRMESNEVGESTAWYALDVLVAAGVAFGRRPRRGRLEFPRPTRYCILREGLSLEPGRYRGA